MDVPESSSQLLHMRLGPRHETARDERIAKGRHQTYEVLRGLWTPTPPS